jgi:hypothetical protein
METQKHGFVWEDNIKRIVFGLTDDEIRASTYTAKHDIPAIVNHRDAGVNVSIKTTATTKVDMADALRIFDATSTEQIHVVILQWRQASPTTKQLQQVIELNLTNATSELFGTVTVAELTALRALIVGIPHGRHATVEEKAAYTALKKGLEAKCGLIRLHPKIDSKSQRRLQCSFNWTTFATRFPERVVSRGAADGNFRDTIIATTVESGVRQFRTK